MTAMLRAVFEDGPPDKPTLVIADSAYTDWPATYDWTATNQNGDMTLYQYLHTRGGHYRVAREQVIS